MNDRDGIPLFRSESYSELGAYLSARVPADQRDQIIFEPSSADELPGRRVILNGEPLCRVVPDASDPRPLPKVVHRFIDLASGAALV